MNRLLLTIFSAVFFLHASAQNLTGQWKGEFTDKSSKYGNWGGDKCEYVLDLEIKGSSVSGFSYTYFADGPKRYYTICKLEGKLDKQKKYIEITEYERTKTNVPAEVGNCFQTHKLTYFKKSDGEESLEGNWIPAPDQKGNCGFGTSLLSRRNLTSSFPGIKNPTLASCSRTFVPQKTTAAILPNLKDKNKPVTINAKPLPAKPKTPPVVVVPKKEVTVKKSPEFVKEPEKIKPTLPSLPSIIDSRFEKRSNTVLKTIEVENESIKIDLYDNGEIDGDSVSLFLNGKLMVAHKKLTTKPLSIRIPLEELNDQNELVMYADNLGSIPPNTALMIVTDGTKRYEVRITSDLQKSGTIRFVKKK